MISRWDKVEANSFRISADLLAFDSFRATSVAQLLGVLYRAIADLELQARAQPNQAFGPGAVYDFLKTLRDLLASATKTIFIIDPYLDEQIFDAYLSTVSPQVTVRVLARNYAAALKPAVAKFVAQKKMAVEIRSSKSLHDRVLFLDDRSCWVLGQSINDAAKAKPTYLAPLASDAVVLKKADYERIWAAASAI